MLNCREVTGVCSDELERPLRLGERTALMVHLAMCTPCRNYREQTRTLHRAMQAYAQGMVPEGLSEDEGASEP